jgi:hypothetical protein
MTVGGVRHGDWADDLEKLREASWEGVIRARDLVRLGVPERTVYRRTQEDGPWTLLLPATIMLSNGAPTRRQLEIAALLYAGAQAVLTGLGGARHHGIRRGEDPTTVHVLIPIDQQITSSGFAIVERTRRMPRAVERDGLPVAPLARCLVDEGRRKKDTSAIAALFTEAVQSRRLLPEMLRLELDRASRKGTAAPRRVLAAVDDGVWSPAEFEAREFWEETTDLPAIRWNVALYDESGLFLAVVDGFVEELGFVWEIDSVEEHFATPEQVRATAARHRLLRSAGLHVLGTRPSQRRDDPEGVREDIRAALEIARLLPPPRITFWPAAA